MTTGPATPAGRYEDAGGYGDQDARVAGGAAVLAEVMATRGCLPREKPKGHEGPADAEEPLVHRRVAAAARKKRRMKHTLVLTALVYIYQIIITRETKS